MHGVKANSNKCRGTRKIGSPETGIRVWGLVSRAHDRKNYPARKRSRGSKFRAIAENPECRPVRMPSLKGDRDFLLEYQTLKKEICRL